MDGLLGVAGMIVASDYGSFPPHSLLSISKFMLLFHLWQKKELIPQGEWDVHCGKDNTSKLLETGNPSHNNRVSVPFFLDQTTWNLPQKSGKHNQL